MWMLLNKQVLKRQSTACAQNGAATIKRRAGCSSECGFPKNPKQI